MTAQTASIYRRILHVSMPLVASLGATTVMEFTDRLFLAHYSLDAIAAAKGWSGAEARHAASNSPVGTAGGVVKGWR